MLSDVHDSIRMIFYAGLLVSVLVMSVVVVSVKNSYETYQHFRMQHEQEVRFASESAENHQWLEMHRQTIRSLVESGLVGALDKLAWVDFLTLLYKSVPTSEFQYQINPHAPITLGSGLTVDKAEIRIYADVLHDGVLGELLDFITENAPGAWYFSSMEVTRESESVRYSTADIDYAGKHSALEVVIRLMSIVIPAEHLTGEST